MGLVMKNIFTDHPSRVGESYLQHMSYALYMAFSMLLGSLACMIHAFFPFIFQKTGSNILFKLIHCVLERSSHTEERVVNLSQTIDEKITQCQVKETA
jgi:hypothetical protein